MSDRTKPRLPLKKRVRRHTDDVYFRACARWASARIREPGHDCDLSAPAIVAPVAHRNGIAQGARLHYAALREMGLDAQLIDATATIRKPFNRAPHKASATYILHCGAPQTAALVNAVMPAARSAHRIGFWAWELPDPEPSWRPYGALVSQIWAPSRFSAQSLGKLFDHPIRVVPHPVLPQEPRSRRDGPFQVLVMADSRSSLKRKNPVGAIKAFRKAFGDDPAAHLTVKLNGGGGDEFDEVTAELSSMPNASCLTRFLDEEDLAALYRRTDVLLSLHRSEGFGLPMLEAMAHGVPAVATAWSGNMDFMSDTDSALVGYDLIPVADTSDIYTNSIWAEPDLNDAACHLQRLGGDRRAHAELSHRAHAAAVATYRRFSAAVQGASSCA